MALAGRVLRRLKREGGDLLNYLKDSLSCSYHQSFDEQQCCLFSYLVSELDQYPANWRKQVLAFAELYNKHYFDLLGSGWSQIAYGMRPLGVEGCRYFSNQKVSPKRLVNRANKLYSTKVKKLISKPYQLIDWQLDFKSGYRWSEGAWYNYISYGHKPGVDIKVPWELARMQHLVQLAFAYRLDADKASLYQQEFRDQVLDFIAHNPPRFGVNWRCAMDVGIRIANWLVAYDLLQAAGALFDRQFEKVFLNSIYDHGKHIVNNLEWHAESIPRSNHYLADVVGLLFVSAYLPCSDEIDAWLAFSIQELVREVEHQFHAEGSNVEGSTSYHRLSAEMVIYATALVLGLPKEKREALKHYDPMWIKRLEGSSLSFYKIPGSNGRSPFPSWYFKRLEHMAEFTMAITKPSGLVAQVGDNDSGRFLKLFPVVEKITVKQAKQRYSQLSNYQALSDEAEYWDEQGLDHRHLVAAINGLFGRDDFTKFAGDYVLETDIVSNLARQIRVQSQCLPAESYVTKSSGKELNLQDCLHYEFPSDSNLLADLKQRYYADFGLLIFSSANFYCHLRLGGVKHGNAGHTHCDQLSIELELEGRTIFEDKGTYLYTPALELRNQYRACSSHNGVRLKGHCCNHIDGRNIFRFMQCLAADAVFIGQCSVVGKLALGETAVYRKVLILPNKIVIEDSIESRHNEALELAKISEEIIDVSFSSGYGKKGWN